ncbi:flavodoxin family protein [Floccifex sp.]|uniref:flavodoxin family protein n=1 Tax=Floccifex sp. TaxID=2815810 RepID=UPI002A74E5E9|nr:flavodoxin family protein [Floccifex sp.]MDD7281928.1 flavodoxin family protein [Erysipelotrichaceae bacterium]MDY2958138.1 flavodoxin family protein [Floccifex sp.]
MKNVVVISTSLRTNSNSDALAKQFEKGAKEAGNQVEFISLRGKNIGFCLGCLSCQSSGSCVIQDDVSEIMEKVLKADVVVWATPIYYYEMSGQMKTLIDRLNPMYSKHYHFKDVYFLATATEDGDYVYEKAVNGLQGWIDCFDGVSLKEVVFCGNVTSPNEIKNNSKLQEAYEMGKQV